LWINEVQADHLTGLLDNNNERDPWIELYNGGPNAVSLDGLYLSSAYTNLTNWAFPSGHSIGPNQFMVIFSDGQAAQTAGAELHTQFRLPQAAGSVVLSRLHNNQPQVLDYVNYTGLNPSNSFGSFPDGQPFDRQQFYYVTPGAPNDGRSAHLVVFINEWMAANTSLSGFADPADGHFEDWFELHNPGTSPVDLAGYFLTDALTNQFKHLITTNGAHVIPARGYLLVWADNETVQNLDGSGVPRADLHVNFALSASGEAIGLFAADGTQIDAVTFGQQTNNVSLGRYPDGTANIVFMPGTATPRSANSLGGSGTPPEFTAPVLVGETLALSWTTQAGQSYVVDYKDNLDAPVWTPFWTNVALGNTMSFTTPTTNTPQRFFRIRQE
jgi:hypothetical protein